MAASGGEAPARSGPVPDLCEYLDRPDALHRRAASVAVVRSGDRGDGPRILDGAGRDDRRARSSRRLSLSSWRRPPLSWAPAGEASSAESRRQGFAAGAAVGGGKMKGAIWDWKPVRVLSRLGKRRSGCLFSIDVAAVRGVPASMDGLRLAVKVRKAETKDGAVQTMPAPVRDGCADFDETLFIKCNLFFTGGAGTGKPLRLEPRRFVVSVVSIEAPGIPLGTHTVDVSSLVLESLQKSSEGRRVRWFDRAFSLSGKATGGELLLKLGFQLMEDAGLCLYTQATEKADDVSPARARVHNKNSFSISSTAAAPKISASDAAISPSMRAYKQLIDRLNVDEHGEPVTSLIPRKFADDELSATSGGDVGYGLPEYEVVDKGVETVKEVVHYQAHRDVLKELDSIADQIEAIEALMTNGGKKSPSPKAVDLLQRLDADEEMVTVEFLRKLEVDDDKGRKLKQPMTPRSESEKKAAPPPAVVPDLGPGLGTAVKTRDGGFLVSTNPFDLPLASGDATPKLAMQVSRPFVLPSSMAATGFDVLQKVAAAGGGDEVRDKVAKLGGMDNLTGKTPEQVGFEGIAEAVIGGRRTEGASSSAARSVRLVRKLAAAVSDGRSERVATGIWTASDDPETLEEVIAFSLQKLEAMAVDALMIQAEMADEDAPFEVAPAAGDATTVFDSLVSPDEWSESHSSDGRVTLLAAIQLRDPSRRYEAVGAPMVAVVQSARLLGAAGGGKFKVRSLHVGGVQLRGPAGAGGRASWSAERQKLTAMQWVLAHGPGPARTGRRARTTTTTPTASSQARQRPDVVWSLSSRVLAGMWLKTVRNPDVKIGATAAGGN
ncbi:protein PLASTID MOVEMENT IMPAIRED 1-like [Oryza brachyantha]|uniref:protein PLASTID MOVEMENT IMPAIRED 1-like n=1 Tax=Oryza brachyantha TaxID=4533 RepID=UPI001ADA1081|nr:protein PLASTID MOVEMENT IMPAIRED 1-like [Oryza brachyantha]